MRIAAYSAAILGGLGLLAVGLGPGHQAAAGFAFGLMGVMALLSIVLARVVVRRAGPIVAYALAIGLRVFLGLGLAGIVFAAKLVPAPPLVYWGWMLTAYLIALIVETVIQVRSVRVTR